MRACPGCANPKCGSNDKLYYHDGTELFTCVLAGKNLYFINLDSCKQDCDKPIESATLQPDANKPAKEEPMCNFIERWFRRMIRKELSRFYRDNLMTFIEDQTKALADLALQMADLGVALDTLDQLILALKSGEVITEDQKTAFTSALTDVQNAAAAIKSKEDQATTDATK